MNERSHAIHGKLCSKNIITCQHHSFFAMHARLDHMLSNLYVVPIFTNVFGSLFDAELYSLPVFWSSGARLFIPISTRVYRLWWQSILEEILSLLLIRVDDWHPNGWMLPAMLISWFPLAPSKDMHVCAVMYVEQYPKTTWFYQMGPCSSAPVRGGALCRMVVGFSEKIYVFHNSAILKSTLT